jgi:hypothetical protein
MKKKNDRILEFYTFPLNLKPKKKNKIQYYQSEILNVEKYPQKSRKFVRVPEVSLMLKKAAHPLCYIFNIFKPTQHIIIFTQIS